jgi:predicted neuraminidase
MNPWTVRIRFYDVHGSKKFPDIVREDEMTENLLVALCKVKAKFVYEDMDAWSSEPVVDPIKRELIYNVELYGRG